MKAIRTILLATATSAALTLPLVAPSPASADPIVDDGGHVHHVITGSGACVAIDAVAFLAEPRGLHRGANESGTDQGPWHGPC